MNSIYRARWNQFSSLETLRRYRASTLEMGPGTRDNSWVGQKRLREPETTLRFCMPMILENSRSWFVAAFAALLCSFAAPGRADEVADFYKGRTITVVVGHETGTGFDLYSRVLARHLGRHIPGRPNIVVQNMLGASGLVAANWLYNIAPKDGTVLMTFVHTAAFERSEEHTSEL